MSLYSHTRTGGRWGGALQCDGAAAYGLVTSHPELNITGPITIAVWLQRASAIDTTTGIVAKYGGGVATQSYLLRIDGSGDPQFLYRGLSTSNVIGTGYMHDTNPHCLVALYDGSALRLYLDGPQIASVASSGSANSNTTDVEIGRYSSGYFNGRLFDVAIWNRALSPVEVTWLNAEPYAMILPPVPEHVWFYLGLGIMSRRSWGSRVGRRQTSVPPF